LLNQKEEGHIVNTASVAGLMSFNGMGSIARQSTRSSQ